MQSANLQTGVELTGVASTIPVFDPKVLVFPTELAASKAAGVAAIRVSLVGCDVQLEELNANQGTIIGFVMHALLTSTKTLSAVAVTQIGGSTTPTQLTNTQRGALTLIANELKQYKASGGVDHVFPPAAGLRRPSDTGSSVVQWTGVIDYSVACALAGVEGLANPFADAGCIISFGAAQIADAVVGDEPDPVEEVPILDIPLEPEPIGPVTQSAPDDPPPPPPGPSPITDTGDGSGGGGGGGGDDGLGSGGDDGTPKQVD